MNKEIKITREELQLRILTAKKLSDVDISEEAMLDILNWDYMIGKSEDFYSLEDHKD